MSYVHPNSKRCEKSEIDLFSVPPTQLSLEKGRWIDYRPLSTVKGNDRPITFMISGTDEYLDLSKTILIVKGKVVNGNGFCLFEWETGHPRHGYIRISFLHRNPLEL